MGSPIKRAPCGGRFAVGDVVQKNKDNQKPAPEVTSQMRGGAVQNGLYPNVSSLALAEHLLEEKAAPDNWQIPSKACTDGPANVKLVILISK